MSKYMIIPAVPYIGLDTIRNRHEVLYNEMERKEILEIVEKIREKDSEGTIIIDGSSRWFNSSVETIQYDTSSIDENVTVGIDKDGLRWDAMLNYLDELDKITIVAYDDISWLYKNSISVEYLLGKPIIDLRKELEE